MSEMMAADLVESDDEWCLALLEQIQRLDSLGLETLLQKNQPAVTRS